MDNFNYEIKPIFKADDQIYEDLMTIEFLCDEDRGSSHNEVYRQSIRRYYVKTEDNKYRFIFGAFYDKQIIGFTFGYNPANEPDNMYLDAFYVHPKYQGLGVGKDLLKTTENALSIIKPTNMELCPLISAITFYQHCKYKNSTGAYMTKKLPKTVNGVIPVFEWCDELHDKLSFTMDESLLITYKNQPKFVYIGKDNKIDGVALLLPDGERLIKLNERQKSLLKQRKLKLLNALDNCR